MNALTYKIPAGRELRIVSYRNEKITVTTTPGSVEVNGAELMQTHTFVNRNFAIFSWFNTEVVVDGRCRSIYVSEDSLMPVYLDIHRQATRDILVLEVAPGGKRCRHKIQHKNLSSVLILGNANHGKFTLAQTLLEYAVRNGESPLFLDLDICSGNISVPGCLTACVMSKDSHYATYAQKMLLSPLVEFYGSTSCMDNPELFKHCLTSVASRVNERLANDEEVAHGGLIVDGGSWYKEDGSKPLLEEVVKLLAIDMILVIHDDQIYNEMKTLLPDCCVKIIPLSKGAISPSTPNEDTTTSLEYYFYGPSGTDAQLALPNELIRSMSELTVVTYPDREKLMHYDTFGPQETDEDQAALKLTSVPISELKNQILAVTDAKSVDDVKTASILGFVFVSMVDESQKKVRLVIPCGGDLPGTILLSGSIRWNLE
ncbi:pre-mRNA cleavage complex II protein Clp1 [Blastocystis sp. ATCC 50177/Nand II]|uniref:Pre-mRNA cleavage complex II protein Clp1 n=1 Tax=Blastocystis sp. subtype 1 (strain ATCC 50177 / NandII) TaxID=478820 RepID=A0A196SLZ3_BLAHN|nr:pre-mRNA cleavage complex II protein Clp1 [Blastocystis sp. ATCC 50177/Nand II]